MVDLLNPGLGGLIFAILLGDLTVMSLTEISNFKASNSEPRLLSQAAQEFLSQVQNILRGFDRDNWLKTGFRDFDTSFGGLRLGRVTTLASAPSMGRSALALNIASNVAIAGKLPTLYLSLEMSVEKMAARILGQLAEIEVHNLYDGQVDLAHDQMLGMAIERIKITPLSLQHCPYVGVDEICLAVKDFRKNQSLTLVIIDDLSYVDLGVTEGGAISQYEKAMKSFRQLAGELNVAILLLSSLNRDLEDRKNKLPRFSDLPSVAIARQSDMLLFLYRDEIYSLEGDDPRRAELIVARNDFGSTGSAYLKTELQYGRFLNY